VYIAVEDVLVVMTDDASATEEGYSDQRLVDSLVGTGTAAAVVEEVVPEKVVDVVGEERLVASAAAVVVVG
jgi:hypothetical protein